MNHQGWIWLTVLALAATSGVEVVRGQDAPGSIELAPGSIVEAPELPGSANVGPPQVVEGGPQVSPLPPQVQVVRFQGPEGVQVDVLGPAPEPVPIGDGKGLLTVGLRVGVGYRLRLSNLPNRPGVELFLVVEIVGHLHRPPGIDPGRYPIRIIFSAEDLADSVERTRLVTKVVYLEDPDQAFPLALPKDEIPTATLTPAEEPLRVAEALGRVMAVVRLGGRTPTPEEMNGAETLGSLGGPCPFSGPDGGRCRLPCGPVRGTPPPTGRPWLPKDEFLCDGGDHGMPLHFGGDGGLAGIDPRDAAIQFRRPTIDQLRPRFDQLKAQRDAGTISETTYESEVRRLERATTGPNRPRVLPTNLVCIYAPRFAEVRTTIGPDQNLTVQPLVGLENIQRQQARILPIGPNRLVQNQGPEMNRHRSRASGLITQQRAGAHEEIRILNSADTVVHLAGHVLPVGPEVAKGRQKPVLMRDTVKLNTIKTAESAVVTGIIEGAAQQIMSWKPQEIAGVEVPPNRPGLAVIKRVNVNEAEPGDVVTFTIQYRNMGNTPIASVSVIDSLLPRLQYVPGSARGPAGTVFTAGENQAGALELRWDLPGTIAPGAEGSVEFQTTIR
ncbi:MAG: DUF11 domain-containing protein [Isosphaeraceae bacterium]